MPYIYKITNKINNKIYIGKTSSTIKKRWQEHCNDSEKRGAESRPLYSAMNKYGINNFIIEQIEEVNTDEEACEKEKYWIEFYGSFKYGYNATKGGDGKAYADYDLIYALWNEGKNISEIHNILKYDYDTISLALSQQGISHEDKVKRGFLNRVKSVAKIDLSTGEIIDIYESISLAEKANGNTRHIAQVCKGTRKSAKGFGWKYI